MKRTELAERLAVVEREIEKAQRETSAWEGETSSIILSMLKAAPDTVIRRNIFAEREPAPSPTLALARALLDIAERERNFSIGALVAERVDLLAALGRGEEQKR